MAASSLQYSSALFPLLLITILMHPTRSMSSTHMKPLDMTPYISCGVCEALAKHLTAELMRTRAELPSYKPRVPEEKLQDIIEVCVDMNASFAPCVGLGTPRETP